MELHRIAAFTDGAAGGNPAGVALCKKMPADAAMLRIAADVGYSETAFVCRQRDRWRVRYFAPQAEVAFCGHATIASAAVLGERLGAQRFTFELNEASIGVDALHEPDDGWAGAFTSPVTRSEPAEDDLVAPVLKSFGLGSSDLDPRLPVRLASAGANHLVIPLRSRERLAAMAYGFEEMQALMTAAGIVTICLIWRQCADRYHARNAFAFGGVYEDPATGAAAAAFGGYLRDLGNIEPGRIEILQGQDMGKPCRLAVQFDSTPGAGVSVSGGTRALEAPQRL